MLACTDLQVSSLGMGQTAWRTILVQRRAFNVLQLFPWSAMMRGWTHGGRQHDICEFFNHLMRRFGASPFHGIWNARVLEAGRLENHDDGVCEQMILLDVPNSGTWHLQASIDAWHHQAFSACSGVGAPMACTALKQISATGAGRTDQQGESGHGLVHGALTS